MVTGSRASKIRRRRRAKKKEYNHSEEQTVHYQLKRRMQGADDDVEYQPDNNQPAGPIETVEHKHAGENLDNPGDVYEPMSLEFRKALSGSGINVWQQATKKCDAAERYEDPTDDGD